MKARLLIAVTLGFLLVPVAQSAAKTPSIKVLTSEKIVATWNCERLLGQTPTKARSPWVPHNASFRRAQLNLWTNNLSRCREHLHARAVALRTGRYDLLPTRDLYALAEQAIAHGAIYSIAWGGASPLLKSLCYEAVSRAFGPNASWARHIVNRESGCNPAATNTKYSSWRQQAKCIAQLIPAYHGWVDYPRCQRDLRYSVQVFYALSNGGRSTGPWS